MYLVFERVEALRTSAARLLAEPPSPLYRAASEPSTSAGGSRGADAPTGAEVRVSECAY
jgi:hypothetical protein